MGRIAGVTAADTRERLLRAAADVFAQRGYDGARVAEIAAMAGVSNGALYAHFGSKTELLTEALHAYWRPLTAVASGASITDLLLAIGQLPSRCRHPRSHLLAEATVAARRDKNVAQQMRDYVSEQSDQLAELIRVAQISGEIDPAVPPKTFAHFCLLLAMGSAIITSDLHAADGEEWAALLTRLIAGLAPAPSGARQGAVE